MLIAFTRLGVGENITAIGGVGTNARGVFLDGSTPPLCLAVQTCARRGVLKRKLGRNGRLRVLTAGCHAKPALGTSPSQAMPPAL